jgi:hypothetical protein
MVLFKKKREFYSWLSSFYAKLRNDEANDDIVENFKFSIDNWMPR